MNVLATLLTSRPTVWPGVKETVRPRLAKFVSETPVICSVPPLKTRLAAAAPRLPLVLTLSSPALRVVGPV